MNCKRARTEIALLVGDDLDDASRRTVERHVSECPDCRDFRREMQTILETLYDLPAAEEERAAHDSVWPSVSSRLNTFDASKHRRSRFNGWAVALSVAAMVLAMVSLSQTGFPGASRPAGTMFGDEAVAIEAPAFESNSPTFPGNAPLLQPAGAPAGGIKADSPFEPLPFERTLSPWEPTPPSHRDGDRRFRL